MGEAFNDAALPDGERFHPLIELSRNAKAKVNLGKEPYTHPQVKVGSHDHARPTSVLTDRMSGGLPPTALLTL